MELNTSQNYVRQYFSDIEGDVPFFAINTTLSVFFLAGACLLLLFLATNLSEGAPARSRLFLVVQAGIFLLLALDDRFQLHEAIAYRVGIGDHYILGVWASLQVANLLLLCRLPLINVTTAILFAGAVAFFAVMMVFDIWVAHDGVLRLSVEDLSKTWATALFLAAAWSLARFHLAPRETDLTLVDLTERVRARCQSRHHLPFRCKQPRI